MINSGISDIPRSSGKSESDKTILLAGASVRYAAESARRAGMRCVAGDLFGDWDTELSSQIAIQVSNWGPDEIGSLVRNARREGVCNLVICGGMEKRVGLLRELDQHFPIVGSSADAVEKTNDPFFLQKVVQGFGKTRQAEQVGFPRTKSGFDATMRGADWLMKPKESAGGHQVAHFDPSSAKPVDDCHFLQERIIGESYSSVFFANAGEVRLIGSTRQLVGSEPFVSPFRPFAYCGSIGPIEHSRDQVEILIHVATELIRESGLAGVFGVDWVLGADGKIWIIEVNPRITSSCEIFELAGQVDSVVGMQCGIRASSHQPCHADILYGKASVYSQCDVVRQVSRELFDWFVANRMDNSRDLNAADGFIGCADIPNCDSQIAPGAPVTTLFAKSRVDRNARVGGNRQAIDEVHETLVDAAKRLHLRMKKLGTAVSSAVPS